MAASDSPYVVLYGHPESTIPVAPYIPINAGV
jgi:hypothetical protein